MHWILFGLLVIGAYYFGVSKGKSANKRIGTKHEPEFFIEYCDSNGELTKRDITPLYNMNDTAFRAWCHLRDEERTFRNERILHCMNLRTNQEIIDLKVQMGWGE